MDDEDEGTTVYPHRFQWVSLISLAFDLLARIAEAWAVFYSDIALATACHMAWRMERQERSEFLEEGTADIERMTEGG